MSGLDMTISPKMLAHSVPVVGPKITILASPDLAREVDQAPCLHRLSCHLLGAGIDHWPELIPPLVELGIALAGQLEVLPRLGPSLCSLLLPQLELFLSLSLDLCDPDVFHDSFANVLQININVAVIIVFFNFH